MRCKRSKHDALRYVDGEMSAEEAADFEIHISSCADCREAVQRFKELKSITGRLKMKDPQDEFWDSYWKSLYRRVERRVAWVFVAIGVAMFAVYAAYEMIRSFKEFSWSNIALGFLIVGVLLLLISVIRERIHQYRVDRYKDVER